MIEQAPVALDSAGTNVQAQHDDPPPPPRASNALRGARLNALFRAIGTDCVRFMSARHSTAKDFDDGTDHRGVPLSTGERALYWRAGHLIDEAIDAGDLGTLIQAWTALRRAAIDRLPAEAGDAPEEALRYDETTMALDLMTFCEVFGAHRHFIH